MVEREVMVINRAGVHARPAAKLVQLANQFTSDVTIECNGDRVNGKSIMGIITLGAGYRTMLTIITEGGDEAAASDALAGLVEGKFEDD